MKKKIEKDIDLYKKCTGLRSNPTREQKEDFIKTFNINIPIKSIVNGIGIMKRNAIEVEIVTPMNSKGLSADYVYYFVDDRYTLDRNNGLTDMKICQFIVGITRAKEKLTLISTENKYPKILDLIDDRKIDILP